MKHLVSQAINGVAYDLSKKNTGIAVFQGPELEHVEQVSFQHHDYFGDVLGGWQQLVLDHIERFKPHWFAYEEVRPVNKYHSEQHFGMVGILALEATRRDLPLIGVNTLTMRKHVLGNGRMTKTEVLSAMQKRYGSRMVPTHDIADAICVGLHAVSIIRPGHVSQGE